MANTILTNSLMRKQAEWMWRMINNQRAEHPSKIILVDFEPDLLRIHCGSVWVSLEMNGKDRIIPIDEFVEQRLAPMLDLLYRRAEKGEAFPNVA